MAKCIMVQGTMSSAGKSYIVTGLCRYYSRRGYRVAPFKSQNMALNSYVTADGLEMGRAQVVQAYACGKEPDVAMNPILLKPSSDVGSQVIVQGRPIGNMKAATYFSYKKRLVPEILAAYEKLAAENDIIIIEGAGSPAEINLRDNDIVNMGLAELLDAPVLLVGDIDPGGVFAQLMGTIDLITDEERDRIQGLIINKFRGDLDLLKPGLAMLEERCGKKVIGVLPMSDAHIEEEDSITSAFATGEGQVSDESIQIRVIHLPRISNFTDFDVFQRMEDVSLSYVTKPSQLLGADLIILPGSKNTIADLRWMKQNGLFDTIRGLSGEIPVMGICGGYQMMGEAIQDPSGIEGGGEEAGLGLLSIKTTLQGDKVTRQASGVFSDISGAFSFLNGKGYMGYEIHNGLSEASGDVSCQNAFGTYIHGVFDSTDVSEALCFYLAERKGMKITGEMESISDYRNRQYDLIADTIEMGLDIKELDRIIGL